MIILKHSNKPIERVEATEDELNDKELWLSKLDMNRFIHEMYVDNEGNKMNYKKLKKFMEIYHGAN